MGGQGLGRSDLSGAVLDRFAAEESLRSAGASAPHTAGSVRLFLVALGLAEPKASRRNDGPVPSILVGPLVSLASVFAERLTGLGYRPGPARARGLVLARLSRWMQARGLGLDGLEESVVDGFFAAEAAIGRPSSRDGERLVRALLVDLGLASWSGRSPEAPPGAAVVNDFRRYLLDERGLAQATADCYTRSVAPLADALCADGAASRWEMLDARMVAGFCRERGAGLSAGSRGVLASALRSFLGWAWLQGLVGADLSGVVFSHAKPGRRLPKRTVPGDAEAMLDATDADTPMGLRDRAVITMLQGKDCVPGRSPGSFWTTSTGLGGPSKWSGKAVLWCCRSPTTWVTRWKRTLSADARPGRWTGACSSRSAPR